MAHSQVGKGEPGSRKKRGEEGTFQGKMEQRAFPPKLNQEKTDGPRKRAHEKNLGSPMNIKAMFFRGKFRQAGREVTRKQ